MKKTHKKEKKHTKKHLTRYIYSLQSFVHLGNQPGSACCLTISNKYTLKQQINLMHLFREIRKLLEIAVRIRN